MTERQWGKECLRAFLACSQSVRERLELIERDPEAASFHFEKMREYASRASGWARSFIAATNE